MGEEKEPQQYTRALAIFNLTRVLGFGTVVNFLHSAYMCIEPF